MSYPVGKTACPRCRGLGRDQHGDNLALYDDNHAFCFSCGYYREGDRGIEYAKRKIIENGPPTTYRGGGLYIPVDLSGQIAADGRNWLLKYGLSLEEIQDNFLWSESCKQLVFPVKAADGTIVLWQGRNFDPNRPKYHTEGSPELTMVMLGEGEPLVLVEDVVSAIKVSRVTTAMPLFGSNISDDRMRHLLAMGYTDFRIWLDADKFIHACKRSARLREMGANAWTIRTTLDPKEYETNEIKQHLTMSSK